MIDLQQLSTEIRTINQANGWVLVQESDWEHPYKIPAVLSLIHSEVSEALEGFRKNDKTNFSEELADIINTLISI